MYILGQETLPFLYTVKLFVCPLGQKNVVFEVSNLSVLDIKFKIDIFNTELVSAKFFAHVPINFNKIGF